MCQCSCSPAEVGTVPKQLPHVFSSDIASSTRSTSTICGNTGRKAPHVTRKHEYLRTSLNFLVIVVISVRPASLRRHTDRDVGHRRRPSGDCPSGFRAEKLRLLQCCLFLHVSLQIALCRLCTNVATQFSGCLLWNLLRRLSQRVNLHSKL